MRNRPLMTLIVNAGLVVVVFVLLMFALAGCGKPDPRACEDAMYEVVKVDPRGVALPVDECCGLSGQEQADLLGRAYLRAWGGDPDGTDRPIVTEVP